MKMSNHKSSLCFLLIGLVWMHSGCTISKNATENKIANKSFKYQTLNAKCSGIYNDAFNEQTFAVNFRISKGAYIWASITGPLSIEGARILITTDSVALIDRINKRFYSGSYESFANKYKISLSFDQIQKILVGDIVNDISTAGSSIENDLLVCTNKNSNNTTSYYLHPKNYTLEKIRVKDRFSVRELIVNFAGYQTISGKQFSFTKNFEINNQQEMAKLQLDFSKVEFDQKLDFNFSIPDTYEKRRF